jgi:hypothetical protein
MTDVVPSRVNIQQEETRFRASVSESMFTRVAGSINLINDRQYDTHDWHLNGQIGLFPVVPGPDGIFAFLFDVEITGFTYRIGDTTGASSSVIVDIHKLSAGGTDDGTIFSTRPQISSAASPDTYTTYRQIDDVTLANPTGHTLAVLGTTEFSAGDALRLDIDQRGTGFQQFQFSINFRPRS